MAKPLRMDPPQTVDWSALPPARRVVSEALRWLGAVFVACVIFHVAFVL